MTFSFTLLNSAHLTNPSLRNYGTIARYSDWVPEVGNLESLDILQHRLSGLHGNCFALLVDNAGRRCGLALAYQCKANLEPSPKGSLLYAWKFGCSTRHRSSGLLEDMCDIVQQQATQQISKILFDGTNPQVKLIKEQKGLRLEKKYLVLESTSNNSQATPNMILR